MTTLLNQCSHHMSLQHVVAMPREQKARSVIRRLDSAFARRGSLVRLVISAEMVPGG